MFVLESVSEPVSMNLFSTNKWDVQQLITQTVSSICALLPTQSPSFLPSKTPVLLPTEMPTHEPTFKPTFRPSNPPTHLPTRKPTKYPTTANPTRSPISPELKSLDLYLILDHSRSMRYYSDLCQHSPGGIPSAPTAIACWGLFLNFVHTLVDQVSNLQVQGSRLGWQDSYNGDLTRGLRVSVYGFACSGDQSIPVTIPITEKAPNITKFQNDMQKADLLIPDGGSCPGQTIEHAAAQVQGNVDQPGNWFADRPFKAAFIISDGIWFDDPRPLLASKGLWYFDVLTFALGIALQQQGISYGLTESQIKLQNSNLLMFAQNDPSRFVNFGLHGINVIPTLTNALVKNLPKMVISSYYNIITKPYWCGWTNEPRCVDTNLIDQDTGTYCKWNIQHSKCYDKNYCLWGRNVCATDPYCEWLEDKCVYKN